MTKNNCDLFFVRTQNARKIIVVDFGFLGDIIHLCPALWMLHENYPQAEIHVVTTPVGAEVLKMVPCVKKSWSYTLTNPSPPWYKSLKLIRRLRKEHFDLLFNFTGTDRTIFFSFALGVKHRVAQISDRWHFYNPLLFPYWVPRIWKEGWSVYDIRCEMLRRCGLRDTLNPENPFQLFPAHSRKIYNLLKANKTNWKYVHCSLNTSTFLKEWSVENWIALCRLILSHYPEVTMLFTCAKKDREIERVEKLKAHLPSERIHVFTEGVSIPMLADILSYCKCHLGCDSGPTHLAWALRIPTLTLYRANPNSVVWTPKGDKHIQLWGKCRCLKEVQEECKNAKTSLCLGEIKPEEVFEKFSLLIM